MAQKIERAAPIAVGNGPDAKSLPSVKIAPQDTAPEEALQRLRAGFLARRHRLAPSTAEAVALLAFETMEARI